MFGLYDSTDMFEWHVCNDSHTSNRHQTEVWFTQTAIKQYRWRLSSHFAFRFLESFSSWTSNLKTADS